MEKSSEKKRVVLLRIQNRKKADEMIQLVWDRANDLFVTEGLKDLFGVKEIRIESRNLLQSLERYGHVLSFLLETMSEAEDFHLPYAYQDEFIFGSEKYTLLEEGDFRVLKWVQEDKLPPPKLDR